MKGRESEVLCLTDDLTRFVCGDTGALARHEGNGRLFVSGPLQRLKYLCERKFIAKVMHDCRAASDVLFQVSHAQL